MTLRPRTGAEERRVLLRSGAADPPADIEVAVRVELVGAIDDVTLGDVLLGPGEGGRPELLAQGVVVRERRDIRH